MNIHTLMRLLLLSQHQTSVILKSTALVTSQENPLPMLQSSQCPSLNLKRFEAPRSVKVEKLVTLQGLLPTE